MVDFFALFEVPRSPWLNEEDLKLRYHAQAMKIHPDRFHQAPLDVQAAATADYAQWNAAYQVLSDPRERLQHLLELEQGGKPFEIQQVSGETMDTGMKIAQLCRETDDFLSRKATITSPLLLAQEFEAGQTWLDQLQSWMRELTSRHDVLLAQVKQLATAWVPTPNDDTGETRVPALPLTRLETIFRELTYLKRWRDQINARIVALSA